MLQPKRLHINFSLSPFFFLRFVFLLFIFLSSFLLGVSSGEASAQTLDSIRSSFHTRPHLTGGFGTNTSFINGFDSPIFNLYGGLDFNHHIRTGVGLSWLQLSPYKTGRNNSPFYLDKIITDVKGRSDTVHPALSFRYFDVYAEYIFYKSKRWQFSVPLQLGIGNSKYEYRYKGATFTEYKHLVFLYQPAVSGYYRIFPWFGVGLDVGYRFMIINNKYIGGKFNSPVYNAYAIVFWDSLYKMFFPNTKLAKKIKG